MNELKANIYLMSIVIILLVSLLIYSIIILFSIDIITGIVASFINIFFGLFIYYKILKKKKSEYNGF